MVLLNPIPLRFQKLILNLDSSLHARPKVAGISEETKSLDTMIYVGNNQPDLNKIENNKNIFCFFLPPFLHFY